VKGILEELELKNPEISILLLDDSQITELNKKYLNRKSPTDVISFPMLDDSFPNPQLQVLGDVVISVETAERQALGRKCRLYDEIIVLLIHGILHLLGHDHKESASKKKMMMHREKEIFKKLMEDKKISSLLKNDK
jgi:probable rRNA maturation factor